MMRLLDQSLFEIYFNLLGENGSCRAVFGVTAKAEVLWSRAMGVCWAGARSSHILCHGTIANVMNDSHVF